MPTTLENRLTEAESALHTLQVGKAAVDVWDGAFRVTYQPSQRDELEKYISELKGQIAVETGGAPTRRPLTFTF